MKRRNFILGLGATAAGGSALLGTGAFSRVESQRSVTIEVAEDPNAYLGLDKCDTPNGSYAHLDDHGHLKIYMDDENPTIGDSPLGEGINSNSTTWFDRVFQICNQGKEDACVWISDDEDWPVVPEGETDEGERRVEFYQEDDDGASLIGEENAILLGLGECLCVGIKVRSYGLEDGDKALDELDNTIQINADVDGDCFLPPEEIEEQAIYLTNSRDRDGDGNEIDGTRLLGVELDGGATLSHLDQLPAPEFDQVDSMAFEPGTGDLYFYDKDTGHLGRHSTPVDPANFEDLGAVGGDPGEVVLGGFVGDRLFVVSQGDNHLYEIADYDSDPEAVAVGDTGTDANGSDIEYALGELWMHSNATNNLYTLDTDTGEATKFCDVDDALTGLAFDEEAGTLLGSLSGFPGGMEPGEIVEISIDMDAGECEIEERYDMTLDGDDYNYTSGDMASGTVVLSPELEGDF